MKSGDKSTQSQKSNEVSAFLEEGCELDGNLTFTGVVRINGKFSGRITSTDGLIIGAPAQVDGVLNVGSANIGGKLNGELHARDRIEIQSSGFVDGIICAPLIVVHEGAQIVGEIKILKASQPAQTAAGAAGQTSKTGQASKAC